MDNSDLEHNRPASQINFVNIASEPWERHFGRTNNEDTDANSDIHFRNRMLDEATTNENGVTEQVVGSASILNTEDNHSENAFAEELDVSGGTDGTGNPEGLDQMELALLTPPKSVIHCALCHNIYTEPKILDCLHTFCQLCLEARRKDLKHKIIFCPICTFNTDIPKGGFCNLPTNPVLANMISLNSAAQLPTSCIICQLHGEENKGTSRCVDCGDIMCTDCCEKHTFSRQTAKHTVVSLEDVKEEILSSLRHQLTANCKKHPSEEAKFYCENCLKPVCRDCILIEHTTHKHLDLGKAIEGIKCDVVSKLDALQTSVNELDVNDHSEIVELINKKEEKEMEVLKDSRDKLIKWIETKFEKCKHDLEAAFERRRNFCETRQKYINDRKMDMEFLKNNVEFFLKDAHSAELALMAVLIKQRIETLKAKIKSTFSRLTNRSRFPTVVFLEDHMKVFESLDLFRVESGNDKKMKSRENCAKNKKTNYIDRKVNQQTVNGKTDLKETDFSHQHSIESLMLLNNRKNKSREIADSQAKMKLEGSRFQGNRALGIQCHPAGLLAHFSDQRISRGRGVMLMGHSKSLLGDYPGQIGQSFGRGRRIVTGDPFFQNNEYRLQPQNFSFNFKNVSRNDSRSFGSQANRKQNRKKTQNNGQERVAAASVIPENALDLTSVNFRMKLQSNVTIRIDQDQQEPQVSGLTFISDQDFAVSDAGNLTVKMFSNSGKFQKFVADPGPMMLTLVADDLVWNSQNSTIKVFNLQQSRVVSLRNVPSTSTHPLTSFRNEKYLIANINKFNIEACKIDGTNVSIIEPHDSDGNTLACVTHIAANTADQLVIADSASKKVVVNNFEGKCIGEYMTDGLCVGGICIDEFHHIFVTDSANNKLILLNPKAQFIREWTTFIENPTCVACNRKGNLIVAGKGSSVFCYQYFHK